MLEVETRSFDVPAAPEPQQKRSRLPSLADLVFGMLAVLLPFVNQKGFFGSDGDLARHLRLGEWMVAHRQLLRTDNFSFTRAGGPFLPFEYGSEVLFALAHRVGGLPAVAVFASLLIATTYGLVMLFLRRCGVDPALTLLVGLLGLSTGSMHWLARPHLFTFVGVAILLFLLEGHERRVWLFAPLFALWANLHGGFLFGLILIAIYLAGSAAEFLRDTTSLCWKRRASFYTRALGVAIAACVVNPFGIELLKHVGRFAGGSTYIKQHTDEFFSPDFYDAGAKLFLLILLVVVAALICAPKRPSFPRLFTIVACIGFALQHQRNIALFGITALPLVALHLDSAWRSLRVPGLGRIREVIAEGDDGSRVGLWALPAAGAMFALALNGGTLRGASLIPARFDASVFPVEIVDRARAGGLTGRIYSEFIWGGYLLYAWPEQKVFIDGGTDFYGPDVLRAFGELKGLEPGWRDALLRWNISLVLMPPTSILTHELSREPGWVIQDCDETAVLLRRTVDPSRMGIDRALSAQQCLKAPSDSPLKTLSF
jgi:hypothetical protein